MAKYSIGTNELNDKSHNLWKSVLAEFIGIFILCFFSCGACTQSNGDLTLISLAFGLSVFMAACTIGHISGCHINPAVTAGLLAAGKISVVRALLYVVFQCAGAAAGVASLKALITDVPGDGAAGLGHTNIKVVSEFQGFGFEFFLGFILVLVVFGVTDENKPDSRFLAPLAIGLTVSLGHLGTVTYTGASMNPARTFGTAFVTGIWDHHWIYWAGPLLGGISAALLYSLCFEAPVQESHDLEKYRQVQQTDEKEMRNFNP